LNNHSFFPLAFSTYCGFCGTKLNVNLIHWSLVEEFSWLFAGDFEAKNNPKFSTKAKIYTFFQYQTKKYFGRYLLG